MPVFNTRCKKCGDTGRVLANRRPSLIPCSKCDGPTEFVNSMTTKVVEVRDNGVMPKKVEQLADIEQINRLPPKSEGEII